MASKSITAEMVCAFEKNLQYEEKSPITIEKYLHDVRAFIQFAGEREISKELVLSYKQRLMNEYAARSVNSKLASLGSFFAFLGWTDCKVKSLKIQTEAYTLEERELTKGEYFRLLNAAAQKNQRLHLIIQTICATGIRVSELQYFTVEAACLGHCARYDHLWRSCFFQSGVFYYTAISGISHDVCQQWCFCGW